MRLGLWDAPAQFLTCYLWAISSSVHVLLATDAGTLVLGAMLLNDTVQSHES